MKHIVIDARNMPTSTGRYVEMLVRNLEKVDTEHRYTILMYPDKMDKWQPTNPNFSAVACPYKEFSLSEQVGFKKQLEQLKPDLVHFSMVQQPIFYRGDVVTTMQDLTTIRFRNHSKNWLIFTVKRWIYIMVNFVAAHKSKAIITPTEFVRQDVARYTHISPNKITATLESVDDFDETAKEIPFFADKQFVMSDGRARSHKNLDRQIEAYALLHKEHPDLYFMLTGKQDSAVEVVKQRVQKLGLADRVIFTGFITDGELKWAWQHAQAYVWASLSEGFGLPPLEAMLHGAPVVSSNASCMPEVLGDAVYYFNPLSVEDMARAIEEVITNSGLQHSLVEQGKLQVKKYSWKLMAEQTLAVYNSVINV
jgi:glycosyltransferase involved in cell wall biosynthesis